jgi:hypothetical protein
MTDRPSARALTITRALGALSLLVIGGLHYQQYRYQFYSRIPTIGPLFLLNFIAAGATGLILLAPLRSRLGRRGELVQISAALTGIGVAAGGLVALLISEHTPLFGFMESGYRFAIVLAIVSDAAAIVLLALFLAGTRFRNPARPSDPARLGDRARPGDRGGRNMPGRIALRGRPDPLPGGPSTNNQPAAPAER